jgi:hypothetical protein
MNSIRSNFRIKQFPSLATVSTNYGPLHWSTFIFIDWRGISLTIWAISSGNLVSADVETVVPQGSRTCDYFHIFLLRKFFDRLWFSQLALGFYIHTYTWRVTNSVIAEPKGQTSVIPKNTAGYNSVLGQPMFHPHKLFSNISLYYVNSVLQLWHRCLLAMMPTLLRYTTSCLLLQGRSL